MIALCTVLCGGETCADMALFGRAKREFLQQFLTLPHGIPSHDTFSRIFRLLDAASFHAWFIGFMKRFAEACQGVVAIDGKTMRRSFDAATGLGATSGERLGGGCAAVSRPACGCRQIERDRGGTEAFGTAVARRPHRHRRRDGLPAQDRRAGDRSGRRLRARAQGQPGRCMMMCAVSWTIRRPRSPGLPTPRPRPHREPYGCADDRHRLAAREPRLAGPQGDRQDHRQPRNNGKTTVETRCYLSVASRRNASMPSCAVTGVSRMAFTGCST